MWRTIAKYEFMHKFMFRYWFRYCCSHCSLLHKFTSGYHNDASFRLHFESIVALSSRLWDQWVSPTKITNGNGKARSVAYMHVSISQILVYRKLRNISPGTIQFRKGFWVGLYTGGLYSERLISGIKKLFGNELTYTLKTYITQLKHCTKSCYTIPV